MTLLSDTWWAKALSKAAFSCGVNGGEALPFLRSTAPWTLAPPTPLLLMRVGETWGGEEKQ